MKNYTSTLGYFLSPSPSLLTYPKFLQVVLGRSDVFPPTPEISERQLEYSNFVLHTADSIVIKIFARSLLATHHGSRLQSFVQVKTQKR
jgi:hypothetical protein